LVASEGLPAFRLTAVRLVVGLAVRQRIVVRTAGSSLCSLPTVGYRSCSVGRISISLTATCRGLVTM
jgi:hypothetical protein